jgi:hypothetical protein
MATFILGFVAGVFFAFTVCIAAYGYAEYIRRAERAKADKRNELARARYAKNPQVPLRSQARSIVRSVIVKEKEIRKFGYSLVDLITVLEGHFDSSMDFLNYGTVWEIDHVEPLKCFDLTDYVQFCRAIHPSNLQPLFRGENQSKGAK